MSGAEDVRAFRMESVLVIFPRTDAARQWFADNCEPTAFDQARGVVTCEHRFGPDLLDGAYQSGLSVTLDGRAADAERRA